MRTAAASKSSKPNRAAPIFESVCPCASPRPPHVKKPMRHRRLMQHAWAPSVACAIAAVARCTGSRIQPALRAVPAGARTPTRERATPDLEMMRTLPQGDPAQAGGAVSVGQGSGGSCRPRPATGSILRWRWQPPVIAARIPSLPSDSWRNCSPRLRLCCPWSGCWPWWSFKRSIERLVLQAENKRLRDDASHDSRDKLLALNRRLHGGVG